MCQLAPRHSLYSIIVLLFYCYTYWHTNWILYTLYLLIQFISTYNIHKIQGVSRLVDITAGGDFLGLCDQKCPYKHVSDFGRLRSYGNFLIPVHALVWTASYGNSWRVMYTAWWLIVCVASIICVTWLAQFTAERQSVLLPAVAFSKTSFKHRSIQIKGNFTKLTHTFIL